MLAQRLVLALAAVTVLTACGGADPEPASSPDGPQTSAPTQQEDTPEQAFGTAFSTQPEAGQIIEEGGFGLVTIGFTGDSSGVPATIYDARTGEPFIVPASEELSGGSDSAYDPDDFVLNETGLYYRGELGGSGLQDGLPGIARIGHETGEVLWSLPSRPEITTETGTEEFMFNSEPQGIVSSQRTRVAVAATVSDALTGLDPDSGEPAWGPVEPAADGTELVDYATGELFQGDTTVGFAIYPGDGSMLLADETSGMISRTLDGATSWELQSDARVVAYGYGKLALYNSSNDAAVILDLATGQELGTLDTSACAPDGGRFAAEDILVATCADSPVGVAFFQV